MIVLITGKLDASTTQSFLTSNREMVADLGSGFYDKQTNDPTVISSNNQNLMRSYAEDQIKSFLEQLEQGLQVEVGK